MRTRSHLRHWYASVRSCSRCAANAALVGWTSCWARRWGRRQRARAAVGCLLRRRSTGARAPLVARAVERATPAASPAAACAAVASAACPWSAARRVLPRSMPLRHLACETPRPQTTRASRGHPIPHCTAVSCTTAAPAAAPAALHAAAAAAAAAVAAAAEMPAAAAAGSAGSAADVNGVALSALAFAALPGATLSPAPSFL